MNTQFLGMATRDRALIGMMKGTIIYQTDVGKKREKLMKALTHNINYLAIVHRAEKAHFMLIKETSDNVHA